jgi:hypothetical protein
MTYIELDGRINENGDLEVHLPDSETKWEQESWTDDEIQEMLTPKRKMMKEVMDWLDANPPVEAWGGMRPEDDPAEFIHKSTT